MGCVYLAQDTLLDRKVALKFLRSLRHDEAARQRFFIEARAIARLSHHNVVGIYRISEVLGQPFLVSEFVAGRSLDKLPLPLSAAEVRTLGIGLSHGLSAAHRRGVLHRDIKP
ncbi:MAG TPA: protein kinase, partial [Pseudomonadota bacterium]|nr:protein kinase [Pseudomonadota bacterium]